MFCYGVPLFGGNYIITYPESYVNNHIFFKVNEENKGPLIEIRPLLWYAL
jgi:hypothetical protein